MTVSLIAKNGFVSVHRRSVAALLICGLAFSAHVEGAFAQDKETPAVGSTTPQDADAAPDEEGALSSSIPALARLKTELKAKGITPQVEYTGETLGNVSGGVRRGAIYEGLLDFGFDADLEKSAGLRGLTFHIDAMQIHGRGLTEYNVDNLATLSGIEARATTRLYEAFFEQKLMDDKLSVKAGNLAEESDFFISDLAAIYVNGTFGWPVIWDQNLPSGGASYPLATPGVRVKLDPNAHTSLLVGVYDGDPTGSGFTGDPQLLDQAGTNFRVQDPPLILAEGRYRYNQEKDSTGLAGQVRLGGWYHFGQFGNAFAVPEAPAQARYSGDFGLYGIIDQMIYRTSKDDPKKGVGVFARLAGSPSDRNFIDFYGDAGVNFAGVLPSRPEDVFGFAVNYSHVSPVATQADELSIAQTGVAMPVRTDEIGLECTYQAQIVPGLSLQPDFQYIIRPGGGVVNPLAPGVRIGNAAVFGLRTTIKF